MKLPIKPVAPIKPEEPSYTYEDTEEFELYSAEELKVPWEELKNNVNQILAENEVDTSKCLVELLCWHSHDSRYPDDDCENLSLVLTETKPMNERVWGFTHDRYIKQYNEYTIALEDYDEACIQYEKDLILFKQYEKELDEKNFNKRLEHVKVFYKSLNLTEDQLHTLVTLQMEGD